MQKVQYGTSLCGKLEISHRIVNKPLSYASADCKKAYDESVDFDAETALDFVTYYPSNDEVISLAFHLLKRDIEIMSEKARQLVV